MFAQIREEFGERVAYHAGEKTHSHSHAYTNRGGEKNLRALETRLLGAGVIVARTSDALLRYHGKMIIIDGRDLYLLAFNLTYVDMERSRSFGVIIISNMWRPDSQATWSNVLPLGTPRGGQ